MAAAQRPGVEDLEMTAQQMDLSMRCISLVRYPCNRQDCVANEACLCRHHMVRSRTFDTTKCKKFRQRSKK